MFVTSIIWLFKQVKIPLKKVNFIEKSDFLIEKNDFFMEY